MTNQRGFLPIGLIVYIVGALAAVALIGGVIYKVNHWCNAACVDAKADGAKQKNRADVAEKKIADAVKRATDMALLWDNERKGRENDLRKLEQQRVALFQPVEAAARNLPAPVRGVLFPRAAAGVLDDAIAAGNASAPEPAAVAPEAAAAAPSAPANVDANVGDVVQWGVSCAKLYAEVADQVRGWQAFYSNLQLAQAKEAIH